MLGVWFTTLVKYSSHAWSLVYYLSEVFKPWSLVYYLSEVFKPCLESGLLPSHARSLSTLVKYSSQVKYSSHAWSLVYYLSEVFKPCLESGLLP